MRNSVRFTRLACAAALLQLFFVQAHAQDQYAFAGSRTTTGRPHHDTNPEKQTLLSVLKDLNRLKGIYFLYAEESIGAKMVNPVRDVKDNIETILSGLLDATGL